MRARIGTTAAAWLFLFLTGTASCGSTAPPDQSDDELSVLFIGNSLTAANDLPAMVAALARAAGIERYRYDAITRGGASLEDHWHDGRALAAIEQSGWDVVVLQQGPSTLASSRLHLIEWAGRFAEQIRAAGGRPALYMVWPPLGGDWGGATRSYTDAARSVDGILFPAGEALRAVHATEPLIDVFSSDDFHPSAAGSYLAALVIVAELSGRSAVGLSAGQSLVSLSAAELERLERAADQANLDHGIPGLAGGLAA